MSRAGFAGLLCLALVAAAALVAPARAGTVYLLNDEEIDGEILDVGVDYVVVKVPGGKQYIPLREVRDVEFRPGESLWEKKLKDALERAKAERIAERERRRQLQHPMPHTVPPPPSVQPVPVEPPPPPFVADAGRFGNFFESERYQFSIRYPTGFKWAEPEPTFLTFKDERGVVPWSFDITFFDSYEEGEFEVIRSRSQGELERVPHYRARVRRLFQVGRYTAERTVGFYERAGRAIRHDQVVVPTRRGVLVIHFFSPGATMEENAVPDVEAVIASIDVK